jgi:hypothetical protein
VAHLGVLDGDPPIAGHTLAKRRRQVWGHLHVLANDLPGGLQRGVGSRGSQLVVGDEALHLLQEAKHHPKRLVTRGRVVPVAVQRRLDTGGAKGWHARLGRHRRHPLGPRQPPPLLPRDDAQRRAQGVTQQVDRVLHPARAPQGAGVQRRPQRPVAKPTVGLGQRHGLLHQPTVKPGRDQPRAEADQRALAKRWPLGVQAVQHQLPAPIHHRCLDHLVIAGAGVGLQDRRQRKLRRCHRRLPLGAFLPGRGQLGLEGVVEQLVAVLAQPHKQLGPPDQPDDGLLSRRRLDGWTPHGWAHARQPPHLARTRWCAAIGATYHKPG